MALIKYILLFITGCTFATSDTTLDSRSRMEELQFTYLEPSSTYVVADGKDEVNFTLKDKRGKKIEKFVLYYSFNEAPYKPLEKENLSTEKEGDFKFYAQSSRKNRSIETIIHARKNLKTNINISKFASLQDLYLLDKDQKLGIKSKNSNYLQGAKYFYKGQELKNLLPLQNLENAKIEVYLNDSKLGDINLKLYDIKIEVEKSELNVGDSLKEIRAKKIVDNKEEVLEEKDLIIKNMDFSLRENVNRDELEAGTYFISTEVEINGEKVQVNEREIIVNYNTTFKDAEPIPLPIYLSELNQLSFKINNIPFLKKGENLYVSDSMLIYKENNKFFAIIIGDLITSSNLDIFKDENIIDSLIVRGSMEMVGLSENISEWPGLINLGNTCFFNSAIKALASTRVLDSQLETYREGNMEIINSIKSLINAIRLGKGSPFYNSNSKLNGEVQKELIQKILINISNSSAYERVDDKRQHDCSEVMNRILEAVMIEDKSKSININFLSIESTFDEKAYLEAKEIYEINRATLKNLIMTQNFLKDSEIKIRETFSFEPISYEFFKFFNLGKTPTVQDLVNINLNHSEIIEEVEIDAETILEKNLPEESYITKDTKTDLKKFYININKNKKILEISNYFILNINRKLTNPKDPKIQLKDERKILNVKELLKLPHFDYLNGKDKILRFEPVACTVHLGGSSGGHYIAYLKDKKSGKWYKNDDSRVNEDEFDDNVGTIYSIIYEKE